MRAGPGIRGAALFPRRVRFAMIFAWLKRRRRRRLLAEPFPKEWLVCLRRNVPFYSRLDEDEQRRLRDALRIFVSEKEFECGGGLAVTEPEPGSEVGAIRPRAMRDGGDYVINGAKTFITNGSIADFVTAAVRTGGPGHRGISLVVIPTDAPGFHCGRRLRKIPADRPCAGWPVVTISMPG